MAKLCHSRGVKLMDVVKEGIRWQDFAIFEGIK